MKNVRETLKDYKRRDLPLDQALSEIQEYHISLLPKEKKIRKRYFICQAELVAYDKGYNQCRKEMHDNLKRGGGDDIKNNRVS